MNIILGFMFLSVHSADSRFCGGKCCAYSYREDGKCRECPSGSFRFDDDNDENCKICTYGFYGEKCTVRCLCSENERCHHVRGCIPVDDDIRCKTICEDNLTKNIKNVSSAIDCDNQDKGSNTATIYGFLFTVPCLIVVLAVFILLANVVRMRNSTSREISTDVNLENIKEETELDIYHTIDENSMLSRTEKLHLNVDSNIDKCLVKSNGKDCRYDVNIVINLQTNHRSSSNNSSSQGKPGQEKVDVDYLNPYTTLKDNWQKETHVYGENKNTRKDNGGEFHLHSYTRIKPQWKKSVDFNIDCTNTGLEYTTDIKSRSKSW